MNALKKYLKTTLLLSFFWSFAGDCRSQINNQDLQSINDAFSSMVKYIYDDSIVQKSGNLLPKPDEVEADNFKKTIDVQFFLHRINETSKTLGNKNKYIPLAKRDFLLSIKGLVSQGLIDTSGAKKSQKESLGSLYIQGVYTSTNSKVIDKIYFDLFRTAAEHKKSQLGQIYLLVKQRGKWIVKKQLITFQS
jgi:hypothetical protein